MMVGRIKMEFKIIENAPERYSENYDLFVELYNKGVLVEEIRRILGWNIKDYNKARHHALDLGDIEDRRIRLKMLNNGRPSLPKRNPANYSFNHSVNKYRVVKTRNGKLEYFGQYSNEKTAQAVVLFLKSVDWDRSKFEKVKENIINEFE